MSANKLVLKHKEIEIQHTIGVTPGLPALIYKDGPEEKTFKSSEITTNETGLGSLVSVPLLRTVDTGGEMLGFFLPQLDTQPGQRRNSRPSASIGNSAGRTHFRASRLRGTASSCTVRRKPCSCRWRKPNSTAAVGYMDPERRGNSNL